MMALLLAAPLLLEGCNSVPNAREFTRTTALLRDPSGTGSALDGRARFRQIFCQVAQADGAVSADDPDCAGILWRLAEEPTAAFSPLPRNRGDLRLVIVTGALSDCFGDAALPFRFGAERLRAQGVTVDYVRVSGRSSAEHNARQIAAFFAAAELPSERIVMLGYSKGAVDIQQFLNDFPELSRGVVAMVSVAGPLWGTPLANRGDWLNRHLFAHLYTDRCPPGDSGLIHSLQPDVRAQWLSTHPLPSSVHLYSLAAFTTSPHLARGLRPTWSRLAEHDTRNDGQVLIGDTVLAGSDLLGYVNADHWGAAITIENELPYVAGRKSPRLIPQTQLLQAIWLYVGESLAGTPPRP